jgi:hypothetical protein
VVEDPLDEAVPVFDRASHVPALDEVKGQGIGPGLFDVVDDEFDVWWHPVFRLVV